MSPYRISIVAIVAALSAIAPASVRTTSASPLSSISIKHGCRTWNARFHPILPILGAGQILVALPSYLPAYRTRTYVHADIYQPPLTFHVWISTSSSTHLLERDILLEVVGDARQPATVAHARNVRQNGKALVIARPSGGERAIDWMYGGIVYTVVTPSSVPLAQEEHIAATLTPGVLRRTRIGASSTTAGLMPCR